MIGLVTKTPEARQDLVEQATHIAADSLDAAARFLNAAEETFSLLGRERLLGELCRFRNRRAAGLRMWQIRGFESHVIFYRPTSEGIDVVRVIHAARDFRRLFEQET